MIIVVQKSRQRPSMCFDDSSTRSFLQYITYLEIIITSVFYINILEFIIWV